MSLLKAFPENYFTDISQLTLQWSFQGQCPSNPDDADHYNLSVRIWCEPEGHIFESRNLFDHGALRTHLREYVEKPRYAEQIFEEITAWLTGVLTYNLIDIEELEEDEQPDEPTKICYAVRLEQRQDDGLIYTLYSGAITINKHDD